MKRVFRWVLGLVGVLLVAVIVTGVVLIVKIYERGDVTDPAVVSENKSLSTVLNAKAQAALSPARTTERVDFLFSEEDLEFLFYAMLREVETPSGLSLDGVDVEVTDGEYTLILSGSVGPLPTVIRAGISFFREQGSFSMTLRQMSAGSLEMVTGVGKWILQRVKAEKLEGALASVGIYCEVDLSTLTVTFTSEHILRTASAFAGDEEDSALLSLLLGVFLDRPDVLEFRLGEEDLLGAVIHLARLKYSREVYGDLPYTYDFDAVAAQVEALFSEGKITAEQVAPVFRLLVKGYASLSDEDKEALSTAELSSVGVTQKETHTGIMQKEKRKLSDFFTDYSVTADEVLLNRTFGIRVTDDMLTEVFRGFDFVGFSLAFPGDENGEVSYIVIEQFNLIAGRDRIDLRIVVNVDGVQIFLAATLGATPAEGLTLSASLEQVQVGELILTEAQRVDLLTYLAAVVAETDFMTVEPAEETVTFNFESLIQQNDVMRALTEHFTFLSPKIVVEDGAIVIIYAAR